MIQHIIIAILVTASIQVRRPSWFPERISCTFAQGTTAVLEKENQSITRTNDRLQIEFAQFNWNRKTGRMRGNQAENDVVILAANETAVTLAEYIDEGSAQITVIYQSTTSRGTFNAVHSRHSEMMDVPIPSQTYGSCRRI